MNELDTWRYQTMETKNGFKVIEVVGAHGWTEATPEGATLEELKEDLERMLAAVNHAIKKKA